MASLRNEKKERGVASDGVKKKEVPLEDGALSFCEKLKK
jgi:hypothetical protein